MGTAAAASLAALLFLGCAADPGVGDGLARAGRIGPDRVTGRARLVGSQPFAQPVLETADGRTVVIEGDLAAEIGMLAGVDIIATGSWADGARPGRTLVATSYELTSVGGEPAVVGTLGRDGDGFFVSTLARDVRLSVVPEALSNRMGARVWIVLDDRKGVAQYGILREPPR
jgi:hypothetical protein